MTVYYTPQYKQTSLDVAGGITDSQTTGIVITSTSGIDTSKPGIACLTYADPLDTDSAEYITFTSIDANKELQGVTRGAEGFAAKSHDNGTVVAFVVSKSHINNLADLLTGASAGAVLDTPKLETEIQDTNGNEWVEITATTSAVNNLKIVNEATGNDPSIEASGDDTNVAIELKGKGTGVIKADGGGFEVAVTAPTSDVEVGDGAAYVTVPAKFDGMNLDALHAYCVTAPTDAEMQIQIHNLTDTADMLSTVLTIDAGENGSDTAATEAVIDTAADDVATNDVLRVDIDQVGSTVAGAGLILRLEFRNA